MGGKVENGSGVENISRLDQSKEERLSQHRKKKNNKERLCQTEVESSDQIGHVGVKCNFNYRKQEELREKQILQKANERERSLGSLHLQSSTQNILLIPL